MIRSRSFDYKNVCTQFVLNEIRGLSDKCLFSLKYLIESCGHIPRKGKDGINNQFKMVLQDLEKDGFIVFDKNYNLSISNINDLIVLNVDPDIFDVVDNFTKLTSSEFDILIRNNKYHNKGTTLHVYLFLKSYYHQATAVNRPIGYYQGLQSICDIVNITPKSLISILTYLVDKKMLVKHYVGSREVTNRGYTKRINVPNIYIPNLGQSQDEINETIKSTVALMKEFYNVDKFLPFMKNGKEN